MEVGEKSGLMRASLPVVLTLESVERENAETFTLYFPRPAQAEAAARGLDLAAFVPGQFFMVWLPRVDEKPYAIAHLDARRLAITVQRRGPFSAKLCDLKPGAKVGLRGPYGRGFWGFRDQGQGAALIGGGCGMAVLGPLAERLPRASVVQGARTAELLLYRKRFAQQVIFTDDGSAGRRGFPTEWLEEEGPAGRVKAVYACGPEAMMSAVAEVCRRHGLACQGCMERYMKCGIGVCGQCDCDGRRVCAEGPVFDAEELAQMPSFGRERRDKAGRRQPEAARDRCPSGPQGGEGRA